MLEKINYWIGLYFEWINYILVSILVFLISMAVYDSHTLDFFQKGEGALILRAGHIVALIAFLFFLVDALIDFLKGDPDIFRNALKKAPAILLYAFMESIANLIYYII